jgi:hypothetical protein
MCFGERVAGYGEGFRIVCFGSHETDGVSAAGDTILYPASTAAHLCDDARIDV